MKQSHIFSTVSQDVLRGRPEHVLHDLKSRPSFVISVLLGSCPELTLVLKPVFAAVTPLRRCCTERIVTPWLEVLLSQTLQKCQ